MKSKKIIFLLIILFSTGCTAEYNLNINEDYTIDEKISINQNIDEIENTYENSDNAKESAKNYVLQKISENELKYGITTITDNTTSYYKNYILNTYQNFYDYNNNSKLNTIFDNFNIDDNNGIITFKLNNIKAEVLNEIDTFEINLTSKYTILNTNATTKNSNTNVYYWEYSDGKKPNITFSINKNEIFVPPVINNTSDNKITKELVIVISFIALALVSSSIFILIKSKRNNRI